MITRLKVKNFKSHESTELKFCPGTNALLGIMGSGKTSLVQAISFALFGETPEIRHRQITLDDLIMRKPSKKDTCEIELDFTYASKNYSVKRKIVRGEGTAHSELRCSGTLIEAPQSKKVTAVIATLIGADYELFEKAVYARQNDMDFFLTYSAPERKKKLDSLLSLDKIESARSGLNKIVRDYSLKISELSKRIDSFDSATLLKQKKELEEKIQLKKKELEELTKRQKQSLDEIVLTKNKLAQSENDARMFNELNILLAQHKSRKTILTERLLELTAVPDFEQGQIETLEKKLTDIRASQKLLEQLSRQIGNLTGKLDEINAQLKKVPIEPAKLIENKISDLNLKIETLSTQIEKNIKLLEEGKDLGANRATLVAKISQLETLKKEYDELNTKQTTLAQKIAPLNSILDDLERESQNLASNKALLFEEKGRLEALLKEGPCPTCKTELSAQKRDELVSEINSSITSLTEKIAASKVDSLKKESDFLSALSKELFAVKQRLSSIENPIGELASKKKDLENLDSQIKNLAEEHTNLKTELESNRLQKEDLLSTRQTLFQKLTLALERTSLEKRKKEFETKVVTLSKKQNEFESIVSKLPQTEKNLELAKKSKEKNLAETELEKVKGQIQNDETNLKSISFNPEKTKILNLKLNQLSSDKALIESSLSHIPILLSQSEELLKKIITDLTSQEKDISNLKKYESTKSNLQLLQNALKLVQYDLRSTFIQRINQNLTSIWSVLYPYGDFLAVRLDVTSKGDYNLELSDSTGWRSVDGLASGGERSLACLALRMAFARVLAPNLAWLILDEPTHNLDSNGIEELSTALRERIPSIINQILLITHEEQLEKSVTGCCYRLVRDKSRDEPTRIETLIGE